MRRILLLLFFIGCFFQISVAFAQGQNQRAYQTLRETFINPSEKAYPKVYWWCLDGNIDTIRAKQEFLEMKNAGIGGFDFFEIGAIGGKDIKPGPAFLCDESVKTIKFAAMEAKKLGLEMGLNVASSWNAGGSWTQAKHGAKSLYKSQITIKGEDQVEALKLPFPEIIFPKEHLVSGTDKSMVPLQANGRPEYYQEIAILAFPANVAKNMLDTNQIVNLTAYFNAATDELKWKAPAGEWIIQRFVCSNSGQQLVLPSPNSVGLTIDHFDADAVRAHLNYVFDRLKPALGDFRNTGLKTIYFASYEAKGGVWTPTLPTEFKKLNGYEITKFLPWIFDKEAFPEMTNKRLKTDFSKTLSELMINNLFNTAREVCNPLGLKVNCEAGGPGYPLYNGPAEPLKALGSVDVPRGEFWVNYHVTYKDEKAGKEIDILRVCKEVSAASHIYQKGIVEEESFTSFQQYQEGPADMKPYADRAFCEGMNRVVFHGFSHVPDGQGKPGNSYHAGTHFNDQLTWWPKAKPFVSYLTRLSAVFQQSKFVADVLYYYGDKVPNTAAAKNSRFIVGGGFDYEVVNTEILLKGLTVKDGKLHLSNGAEYSVLALNDEDEINPAVLAKLNELTLQGAKIVGVQPNAVGKFLNDPKKDALNEQIFKTIWLDETNPSAIATHKVPGIYTAVKPIDLLTAMNVKSDITYADKDSFLIDFIHYQKDGNDIYFVRNNSNQAQTRLIGFRQTGKVPELWNPQTGEIIRIPMYNLSDVYTNIQLSFSAYGSYLLVFREGNETPNFTGVTSKTQVPMNIQYTPGGIWIAENGKYELKSAKGTKTVEVKNIAQQITGDWNLNFTKGWGAPDTTVFPQLTSWTASENEGIKYYSGTATYTKSFDYKKNLVKKSRIFLDLGDVSKIAEVWLNGQSLGITWTKPFRYDVTEVVKNGTNDLKIEVTNTWSNRIVGDALTGSKFTQTNIKASVLPSPSILVGDPTEVPWAKVPLIESGLLGPITIQSVMLVN